MDHYAFLPLPEWRPDGKTLTPDHLRDARNTIFRDGAYCPFPSVSPRRGVNLRTDYRRVHAADSFTFSDGVERTFLFADSSLIELSVAQTVVETISATISRQWISRYGDFVIYGGAGMAPRRYNPVTKAAPSGLGEAPMGATTAAQVYDNLFLGVDAKVYHSDSFRIQHWPDSADPGNSLEIALPRGGIVRAIVGTQYAHVFCSDSIHRFIPSGGGSYSREVLTAETGILGEHHAPVLIHNADIFTLSHDGVLHISGGNLRNIGNGRVNEWLLDTIDPLREREIAGVHDRIRNLIMWTLPRDGADNLILVYNYIYDRFTYAEVNAQHLVFARPPPVYTDSPSVKDKLTDAPDIAGKLTDDPSFGSGRPLLMVVYPAMADPDNHVVPTWADGERPIWADGSNPSWRSTPSGTMSLSYEFLHGDGDDDAGSLDAYFETPAVSPANLLFPAMKAGTERYAGDAMLDAGTAKAVAHAKAMREMQQIVSKTASVNVVKVGPVMSGELDGYKMGAEATDHLVTLSFGAVQAGIPDDNGWTWIGRHGVYFRFSLFITGAWRHAEAMIVHLQAWGDPEAPSMERTWG